MKAQLRSFMGISTDAAANLETSAVMYACL